MRLQSRRRISLLAGLTLLMTVLPAVAATPFALAQPAVSINELRIDQPSTDNDEYFELVGAAGTALDGLTYLVIGDGTVGSGVIENVTDLTGEVIPGGGFFVAAESTFTLATADLTTSLNFENGDNVTHLLVDGFTGANGDDLDTNDDGVLDATPWTSVVDLIALVEEANPPSGTVFHYGPPSVGPDGSFVPGHAFLCTAGWEIGAFDPVGGMDTPGAANDCAAPPTTELVINEIIQNPDAVFDSNGEWFELFNPTGSPIDIDGFTIKDDGSNSHLINNGGPLNVPPGGFVVLGRNDDSGSNGGVTVDYEYANFFLGNGDDEVILLDGSMAEVDRVAYDGGPGFPDPTGASMSLANPTFDNNVGANWCEASTAFGDGDFGTPGAVNDCPPPEVVINEIIQNPNAVFDSNGEWFELYNPGNAPVNIDGWDITDDGSNTHTINNGGPLNVPASGYLVLGRNDDSGSNGGVTVDYEYSSFFLGNSDDEVVLTDNLGNEIDRVNYDGGPGFPDPTGASMSLANPTLDNNVGANWCTASTPFGDGDLGTPGAANDCLLFIHDVQTAGATGLSGPVNVEAIVISLLEDNDVLGGFLLQEEDAHADLDAATSEGIRVDCGGSCPGLAVGDLVAVSGDAGETFGMTEIDATGGTVMIISSGNPLPAATPVTLPSLTGTDEETTFEALEGMLAVFTDKLVVSEYFELARFGQVVLTVDDRPFQFTHLNAPSVAGFTAFLDDLARSRIVLDDNNNDQNDAIFGPAADEPYFYPEPGFSTTNRFRGGDSITGLTGVLDWAFGEWRVKPSPDAFDYTFIPDNARPAVPDPVGGTLKVASFNVLNYFTTIDVTSSNSSGDCGPFAVLDCRGADSAAELVRQRDKIVAAMAQIDADIVGLIEIENNADASLIDLVGGLNAAVGAGTYDYVDTGTIGTDAIKVAFIYKPATVTPVGPFAVLDSSVDPTFIDTKNRPVLIQTFEEVSSGERVTVAVNHLKSKGSACDDVGDPGLGDGQANCNLTRTSAATALVNYLATDPTGSGDPDFLIIGDLNAYAMEDPIAALTGAGYTDLIDLFGGSGSYSFVFDGQLGYLDHALANGNLLPQVTGVTEWHINADEVNVLDYNDSILDPGEASFERKSNALLIYEANAFRSSDHDPLVVGLLLASPEGNKKQVSADLEGILPTGDNNTDRRLNRAIDGVEQSLNPAWWENESEINNKKVFDGERQAVAQLVLIVAEGGPLAGDAQAAIDLLIEADRLLAQVAINAAIAGGGDPVMIAEAQAEMALAAADVAAGLFNEAVNHYKTAWDKATKAL